MSKITPLLEQYNGLVNVIMNTDYSIQEYQATEQQLANTLKAMNGKVSREHIQNITRICQVLNSEKVMVPMAETLSNIESQESFDHLLHQFLECFEEGRNETATAQACYQAMMKLDPQRVAREGIDQHPFFL